MGVLTVTDLGKDFGDITALESVSLELAQGEILGILGPNGAGKTTLIHCILGLITPTHGMIEAFGMDIHAERAGILRRMNFASNYVSLPLSLTPWENLMVYALLYEVPDRKERCREVLRLFDLYPLKDRPLRRLSSGQMMRLSLAKAIINNPEILLLDEPTSGLDPEISLKARDLLKNLSRGRGLSVIYTSHNLKEMEEVSDRLLFLNRGKVHAMGTPRDLLKRYNVTNLEEFYFKVLQGEA